MIDLNYNEKLRVLVIDDEQGVHGAFRRILGRAFRMKRPEGSPSDFIGIGIDPSQLPRFEIDSAYQGEEGLARVKQAMRHGQSYILAFVDVRMPGRWDGIETIRQIWKVEPNLHIVISSGYQDYSWDQLLDELGRSDRLLVLMKPFEPIEVRQVTFMLYEKWLLNQHIQQRFGKLVKIVSERNRELEQVNESLRKEMRSRQNMEVELRHVQRRESVGRLAADIAHEIGPPIQSVGDGIDFLKKAFESLQQLVSTYQDMIGSDTTETVLQEQMKQAEEATDLEYLYEHVPKAIDRSLDELERMADIVRCMQEFAQSDQKEKKPAD